MVVEVVEVVELNVQVMAAALLKTLANKLMR